MKFENLEYEIDKDLENELLYSILEEEYKKTKKSKKPARRKISSKKKNIVKNEIKIRTVLFLLVTLIANTYAWFIFNTTVSSKLDVHIKSWQFELEAGENTEDFVFRVEEIYPGMPEAVSSIEANNKGETDAKLTCTVTYIQILDDIYYVLPDKPEDQVAGRTYLTSPQLIDKLLNDYPFTIEIYIDGELYDGTEEVIIPASSDKINIEYKLNWPYETGTGDEIEANDAIDTEWGERAYDFYHDPANAGNNYCIEVALTIKAQQVYSEEPPVGP